MDPQGAPGSVLAGDLHLSVDVRVRSMGILANSVDPCECGMLNLNIGHRGLQKGEWSLSLYPNVLYMGR